MAAPTLRKVLAADAAACGSVQYACWVETYTALADADFWERMSPQRCIATWEHWLDLGLDATLAEMADGEVIGFAFARPSEERYGHPPVRETQLNTLYVRAAHHGTGVGQALLDAVLPPGMPAQLWVAEGNPRAVRFYERNGFRADGASSATCATDGGAVFGGIAAIRMVR